MDVVLLQARKHGRLGGRAAGQRGKHQAVLGGVVRVEKLAQPHALHTQAARRTRGCAPGNQGCGQGSGGGKVPSLRLVNGAQVVRNVLTHGMNGCGHGWIPGTWMG